MRSKDKALYFGVALVAVIVSLIVARALFGSPGKRNLTAPTVESVSNSLPDVNNDPNYNHFLNAHALDPALPVSIGNSQNRVPFR